MDASDVKRLAETVEAGLRDGRSLDSLRNAMKESGYGDEDIRHVVENVDRKKTVRRPMRAKQDRGGWIAASVVIAALLIVGLYLSIPQSQPRIPNSSGGLNEIVGTDESGGIRTCYVINESVKQIMVDAGAQCDKWYLIKEI